MQLFRFLDWLLANHQSTNMICGEEKEKKPSCFDSAFLLHQKFLMFVYLLCPPFWTFYISKSNLMKTEYVR